IYELTQRGEIVAIRELADVTLRNPQGMVFAPSGDLTDDPSLLNLYIADSGLTSSRSVLPDSLEVRDVAASYPGHIVEITFEEPVQIAATTDEAVLIRTS